ncbi:MAG: zf-HC2 domain-containing protein [Candidatus Acidiferrales bacterium]
MNHFDEMTGLLYLEGQLDAAHAQEISSHISSCAACRGLLHALQTEGVWLRQALAEEEESVPARLMEAPGRGGAPWGWIATLGFGAGGAYTVWNSIIEPWQAQAAQAGFTQGNLLTMLFFSGAFWKGWDTMRTLTEFSAVATLGVILIWLLLRHWRHIMTVAVIMGAFLCALALPPSAAAGETVHGKPNYTLEAGQEVKTDLFVGAESVRIDGDIDGDLIVASHRTVVNGHVKGDVIFFGQELMVNGVVDGNLRIWGERLAINGTVGRNVMSWTGDLDLDEKGKVGGSMTMGAGNVNLNGQVGGDILAFTNEIEVNGSLGRDARVRAGHLTIGPHAEIKGRTKYDGRNEAEVSPSAKLGSPIQFSLVKRGPDYKEPRFYWHRTLFWGASFLFGIVVLLLAPGFFFDASHACNKFGPATGFGILFLIATPIAAILACFTIVGIGVAIATLLVYLIVLYAAQVFVGSWLGEKLLGPSEGTGAAIGRLALGLAILRVLRMLPYAGAFVTSVVLVWGIGAVALAIYKNLRPVTAPA